jgi:hypothetical protein
MAVSTFPSGTSQRLPEWTRALSAHANVLLEGQRDQTDAAVLHLLPHLRAPIVYRKPGDDLTLPNECTVILRDVDRLCKTEQTRLHEWLDRMPDCVQTIATTESSLFALVQDGQFESDLYYRLNVILLRLDVEAEPQY